MIPYISETTTNPAPSKTFCLDFDSFELTSGVIEGEEAVRQAIQVICAVRRGTPGFPEGFGLDLEPVMGTPKDFAAANIERLITEALSFDDRIEAVDDFEIDTDGEHGIVAGFNVYLSTGENFREEVTVNA